MRMAAVCVVLLSAYAAIAVEFSALPSSEFADTEVSTNFVFAVGEGEYVM